MLYNIVLYNGTYAHTSVRTFICIADGYIINFLMLFLFRYTWSLILFVCCLCVCFSQPSECEQCTCDSDGIARCLVADCAPPPCVNPVYQPGKCCPECKEGKFK